jgi:cellulose synthase/poly-beta-1,6-N-acetylglucosamine synthase-like glycosyltransferase
MNTSEWICSACIALVGYTYIGYPLLLFAWAHCVRTRERVRSGPAARSASIVIAAHNEANSIRRRLVELTRLARNAAIPVEVILVSDGSADRTALLAREVEGVRVEVLARNVGKAAALNEGVRVATGEILLFGDVRQTWAPDAVNRLLENFEDPAVGAATGELLLTTDGQVNAGVGMYWRFEKWMRQRESQVNSTIGVTGAICGVRRSLYRPLPVGTILDDVYWPLRVVMAGYRVVYDRRARATDRLPSTLRDEFRRKLRTQVGNFQLVSLVPGALLPWRNPIWAQFISHKLARLAVPWALGVLLLAPLLGLPSPIWRIAVGLHLAFYGMAIAGLALGRRCRVKAFSAAASFVLLNAAAWTAFWVWLFRAESASWRKIEYDAPFTPERRPDEPGATGR